MAVSYVSALLKLKNRPSNKQSFKFIVLKWFLDLDCRIVLDDESKTKKIPNFWETCFRITTTGVCLYPLFHDDPLGISAQLIVSSNFLYLI